MRRLPAQAEALPAATRRRHVHAAPHLRIPFGHRLSDQAPVFWDSKGAIKLVLGCPEMFMEQTRRRLGLPMAEQDGRKVNPLGTIRPRQTAFAGVAMAGENRPIAEIRLAGPA